MRKRIVLIVSLILIALLSINLLFREGLYSEYLKRVLTSRLAESLHASVSIENVRLNLFPPFFRAESLVIDQKPSSPSPLIRAGQVSISFSLLSLMSKTPVIREIQLRNPDIHLIRNRDGTTNFDFLAPIFSGGGTALLIDRILLITGSLTMTEISQNRQIAIPEFDLSADLNPLSGPVRISGATQGIFIDLQGTRKGVVSKSDWKLTADSRTIRIEKLNVASRDDSIQLGGEIGWTGNQDETPFRIGGDFHLSSSIRNRFFGALSGHLETSGTARYPDRGSGQIAVTRLALERGKSTQNIGGISGSFKIDTRTVQIDGIRSDLFGGDTSGNLSVALGSESPDFELLVNIRNLFLDRLAFLVPESYRRLTGKRSLDLNAMVRLKKLDMNQFESAGHLHIAGPAQQKPDSGKPFAENALAALRSVDMDYAVNPLSLVFRNAAVQTASSSLLGSGRIQKNGEVHAEISAHTDKGGEVLAWLGYPDWSGAGEFAGSVDGTLLSPVLSGTGNIREASYEGHALGGGKAELKYADRIFSFSNARIEKGGGTYSGEGAVQWNSGKQFAYRMTLEARNGVPDDIIALFTRPIPLDARASGPVTLSGDDHSIEANGKMRLASGRFYGENFDSGMVVFRVTNRDITFPEARLTRGSSELTGSGAIAFDGSYQVEIRARKINFEEISLLENRFPALNGSFSGTLTGKGSFDRPALGIEGHLNNIAYRNQGLRDASLTIRLQEKDLRAELTFDQQPLSITGAVQLESPYPASIDLEGENIPLIPLLAATSGFDLSGASGTLSGSVRIDGPLENPDRLNYVVKLQKLSGEVSGYSITNQGDLILQLQNGALNIESFRLQGEGTSLTVTGGFDSLSQINLFVTGEADLSLLKAFSREITFGEGKAYLALHLFNSWNDPKFQGGLTVQEGRIRTSFFPKPLVISSMGLFFNERQVLLDSFDAALGEGSFQVTGKIDLNRFKPAHFGLILETGESPFTILPGWTSRLSGALIYQGDLASQSLQGEMSVSHGVYSKNFELKPLLKKLTEIRENRKQPIPVIGGTRLNIHLVGQDDLRVNNNVARIPFTADLTLKGTIDHPVLIGRMESDSGFINFYNKNFTVNSISVDFIDPENIKPLFDIKARTQVIGKDRNYQIDLALNGTLEEMNRTLTADDPTLTETDILSLILAGKKATEVATDPATQQNIGGTFVPFVIESPFEGLLEDLTGLNRLSIEPVAPGIRSTGGPRVTVEEHLLNDKLLLNYFYIMNPTQDQNVQLDYLLNRHFYLQGIRNEEGSIGGNLKLRFEFK